MAPSKLIAGFVGPLLLAIGIAMAINRDVFPTIALQLTENTGLVFLSGMLSLVAGIAIVRVHNIWSGWPVILTVLGWLAIVGGLLRMWAPQMAAPIARTAGSDPNTLLIASGLLALLGGFLSFKSYAS